MRKYVFLMRLSIIIFRNYAWWYTPCNLSTREDWSRKRVSLRLAHLRRPCLKTQTKTDIRGRLLLFLFISVRGRFSSRLGAPPKLLLNKEAENTTQKKMQTKRSQRAEHSSAEAADDFASFLTVGISLCKTVVETSWRGDPTSVSRRDYDLNSEPPRMGLAVEKSAQTFSPLYSLPARLSPLPSERSILLCPARPVRWKVASDLLC